MAARTLKLTLPRMRGRDVKAWQRTLNRKLGHWKVDHRIETDGEYGNATREAALTVLYGLGIDRAHMKKHGVTPSLRIKVRHSALTVAERRRWAARANWRRRLRKRHASTLRERAYKAASGLVGVMEEGGNNQGRMVMKIIRANGGAGPEPWCGDGMAYCYRLAGSKAVTRAWASVRAYLGIAGVKRTSSPKRGDLVRFTFDHIGMFVKDNGDGTIEAIEFNTGASGAVSDSSTGGDGVYRKRRAKSLVRDYLAITR